MPRRRSTSQDSNTQQLIRSCRHCGEYYTSDEEAIEHVCPACAEARYFTCHSCGSAAEVAESTVVSSGERICSRCARTQAYFCPECEEWHLYSRRSHIVTHDSDYICDECADGYELCACCGEYFRIDDMEEPDEDEYVCHRCAARRGSGDIYSYSYKPAPIFHRADGEGQNSLVLGIELEMDAARGGDPRAAAHRIKSRFGDEWLYFKRDSSLDNGVELVTHPISPKVLLSEQGRSMWSCICAEALAEGMRSHDTETCGLHVHVNRNYFGTSEAVRLVTEYKLATLVDRLFEPLAIFSRRKRARLENWARRPQVPNGGGSWLARARATHLVMTSTRYNAVNILNDNTIEFRLFRGTLKPETLFATFAFISGLCDYARQCTPTDAERISWYALCDEIISRCPEGGRELADYLIEKELIVEGAMTCAS